MTRMTEGQNVYLIVWDSLYLDLEDITENETGANTIHCEYIRFQRYQLYQASFNITLANRGKDIYFSEPCSYDSDWDRILSVKGNLLISPGGISVLKDMVKDPVGRSPLMGSIHSRHLLSGGVSPCRGIWANYDGSIHHMKEGAS